MPTSSKTGYIHCLKSLFMGKVVFCLKCQGQALTFRLSVVVPGQQVLRNYTYTLSTVFSLILYHGGYQIGGCNQCVHHKTIYLTKCTNVFPVFAWSLFYLCPADNERNWRENHLLKVEESKDLSLFCEMQYCVREIVASTMRSSKCLTLSLTS